MNKIIILLIALIANTFCLFSQNGTIRGFVYEKGTGEPIIFTNVYLKGTTVGSVTDVNGFFNISKLNKGNYTLIATYLGYDTAQIPIEIKSNDAIITQKIFLNKSSFNINIVNVSAERQEMLSEVKTSIIKITPREIEKIPSIGATPDIAQYLQVVPGVVVSGDQGGQLYIRGGSPIQNKVILDGMVIYNPFHSIGLFSVFDGDIIRNTDIYTGGFNAEYGGRISSIMDITTRNGNKNKLSGSLEVNPFLSKVLLEGPLGKHDEFKQSSSSFIVSAKNSYLDESSKYLYSYIDSAGLPYSFTDLYAKYSIEAGNGSRVNIFGFNFKDKVSYQEVSDLHWDSYGGGSNFVLIPAGSNSLIKGVIAASSYEIFFEESLQTPRYSKVNGFNGGLDFTYFIGDDEFTWGFEAQGFTTDFSFTNASSQFITQKKSNSEMAGFFKYKLNLKKIIAEPGLRIIYYGSIPKFNVEPRLGVKYNAFKRVRFKGSFGRYSQNILSGSSDRDVVNLFYGFLSGPDSYQKTFDGKEIKDPLQKAWHYILGAEIDLNKRLVLNIEGYYKDFDQLINLNRNKIYENTSENYEIPDYLKMDFIIEKGIAKGLDVFLKYDYKNIFLWMVYSYLETNRYDGIIEYVPHFDRRHNVNLTASYEFGKDFSWRFNARWNYGSGFPFTKTQGYYEHVSFNDGVFTDYVTSNNDLNILYGNLNDGRLPQYHRLDISVSKTIALTKNATLDMVGSVTNVYNRNNIFYFNRVKHSRVDQLPILPSIGIKLSF